MFSSSFFVWAECQLLPELLWLSHFSELPKVFENSSLLYFEFLLTFFKEPIKSGAFSFIDSMSWLLVLNKKS
jgi:hypothetical protein